MTTAAAQFSDFCKVSSSHTPRLRLRTTPSIDTMLKRGQPIATSKVVPAPRERENRQEVLDVAESELRQRELELVRHRAELTERERVVGETEILLAAREQLLENREAMMASRQADVSADLRVVALQKTLEELRLSLAVMQESLGEKDNQLARLRADLQEAKSAAASAPVAAESDSDDAYGAVAHPSLAEQVALLREREAFIEQSENKLFDKAQELQEWETRLQQQEHDHIQGSATV